MAPSKPPPFVSGDRYKSGGGLSSFVSGDRSQSGGGMSRLVSALARGGPAPPRTTVKYNLVPSQRPGDPLVRAPGMVRPSTLFKSGLAPVNDLQRMHPFVSTTDAQRKARSRSLTLERANSNAFHSSPRSNFQQTLGLFTGMGRGLFELLKGSAVGAPIGLGQLAFDVGSSPFRDGPVLDNADGAGWQREYFKDTSNVASGFKEGGYKFGQAVMAAGQRMHGTPVNTGSGEPTIPLVAPPTAQQRYTTDRYNEAVASGNWMDEIASDIGMASMVAGAAGAVLGRGYSTASAASAGTRGSGLARVANWAERSAARAAAGERVGLAGRAAGRVVPSGTARTLSELGEAAERLSYRADWGDPVIGGFRSLRAGTRKAWDALPDDSRTRGIINTQLSKLDRAKRDRNARRDVFSGTVTTQAEWAQAAQQVRRIANQFDLPKPVERQIVLSLSHEATTSFEALARLEDKLGTDAARPRIQQVLDGLNTDKVNELQLSIDDFEAWKDRTSGRWDDETQYQYDMLEEETLKVLDTRDAVTAARGIVDSDQMSPRRLQAVEPLWPDLDGPNLDEGPFSGQLSEFAPDQITKDVERQIATQRLDDLTEELKTLDIETEPVRFREIQEESSQLRTNLYGASGRGAGVGRFVEQHVTERETSLAAEVERAQATLDQANANVLPLRAEAGMNVAQADPRATSAPGTDPRTGRRFDVRKADQQMAELSVQAAVARAAPLEKALEAKTTEFIGKLRESGRLDNEARMIFREMEDLKTQINDLAAEIDNPSLIPVLEDIGIAIEQLDMLSEGNRAAREAAIDRLSDWQKARKQNLRDRLPLNQYLDENRGPMGKLADEATRAVDDVAAAQRQAEIANLELSSASTTPEAPGSWKREDPNTTLSLNEQLHTDAGAADARRIEAEKEIRKAERRVEAAQKQLDEFRDNLSVNTQSKIQNAGRAMTARFMKIIDDWGGKIGRYDVEDSGTVIGVAGDMLRRYNLEAEGTQRLDALSDFAEKQKMSQFEYKKAVYHEVVDMLGNEIDAADRLTLDRAHMAESLRDELVVFQQIMEDNDGVSQWLLMHDLIDSKFREINDIDGFNSQVGDDVIRGLDDAVGQFKKTRDRLLLEDVDGIEGTAPSRYRVGIETSKRVMHGLIEQSDEAFRLFKRARDSGDDLEMAAQRAVMNAIDSSIAEVPTTLFELNKAGIVPRHLMAGSGYTGVGGKRPGGGGQEQRLGATGAERRRSRNARIDPDLDRYMLREAGQISEMALSESLKKLANDDTYSTSMDALLKDKVNNGNYDQQLTMAEWKEQNPHQQMPWSERVRQAELRGYTHVGNIIPEIINERAGTIDPTMRNLVDETTGAARADEYSGQPLDRAWEPYKDDTTVYNSNNPFRATLDEQMAARGESTMGPARMLPNALIDEYAAMREKRGKYTRLFDETTQLWKTSVLPLSPKWLTNNAIGNAIMAVISGQMRVTDMIYQFGRVLDLEAEELSRITGTPQSRWNVLARSYKDGGGVDSTPRRLAALGNTHAERMSAMANAAPDTWMGRRVADVSDPGYNRNMSEATGRKRYIRKGISRTTSNSYAFNEWTDNMFRSMVYMQKMDEAAATLPLEFRSSEASYIPKDRSEIPDNKLDEYDEAVARNQEQSEKAVKHALAALGDFSRLTSAERKYWKRVLPFYPWLRHQTAITLRLPFQSPLRMAALNAINNYVVEEEGGQFFMDRFAMSIPTPFGRIDMGGANPYTSPLDTPLNPLANEQVTRSINPVLSLGPSMFMNHDFGQNAPLSRPVTQRGLDPYGNREQTGLFRLIGNGNFKDAIGEAGYRIAGTSGIGTGLRDLALSVTPGMDQAGEGPRPLGASAYDSGHASPYPGQRRSLMEQLLRTANLPFVPTHTEDLEETLRKADERVYYQGE